MQSLEGQKIVLVIGGGIAAYKALDLTRRLRERGASVRAVLTASATRFVTPLSVSAISGDRVFSDLFDPDGEHDVGHIRLSREADLIVVAPATADLLAKMANGLADDLATAVLLAADKPVLVAPAMNPRMWSHPATRRNVARLEADGVRFVGPEAGEMAESGESGVGRLAEPMAIVAAIEQALAAGPRPLDHFRAVVTSGPTHEPIDPVRYIANRSSGRQGHAIAAALARAGCHVTLVSGPVEIAPPTAVAVVAVETARQMRDAVEAALPADIAVLAAAVADWRVETAGAQKLKKQAGGAVSLDLVENPDILAGLARHAERPALLIGFAAETEDVLANAVAKLRRKGCDWILANDVSPAAGGVLGGPNNRIHLVSAEGVEDWPEMSKRDVAEALVARIVAAFSAAPEEPAAHPDANPEPDVDQSDSAGPVRAEIPVAPEPVHADAPIAPAPRPREAPGPLDGLLDIRPTR